MEKTFVKSNKKKSKHPNLKKTTKTKEVPEQVIEEIQVRPDVHEELPQTSVVDARLTDTRTPSPFQKNKNTVSPLDNEEAPCNQSTGSVRATTPVKEAWLDNNEDGGKEPECNKTDADKERERRERNAYVPYVYARESIQHVVADMETMKSRHVYIVHSIEANYRLIEQETQSQFNAFVLLLRQQYSHKVQLCRQGIGSHRTELCEKEAHWKQLLASLSKRNNQLLREKNTLLARTKLELDSMDNEKGDQPLAASTPVTSVERYRDDGPQSHSPAPLVTSEGVVVVASNRTEVDRLLSENQRLKDELLAERNQVAEIQSQLLGASPSNTTRIAGTDDTKIISEQEPILMALPVGSQVEAEHESVRAEREAILTEQARELDMVAEERESFIAERDRYNKERSRLQSVAIDNTKEAAELRAKCDILTNQMKEHLALQASYKNLQEQYGVVAMTASKGEGTGEFVKDQLQSTKDEQGSVLREKKRLGSEIDKWERDFEKKNGRSPTEEDKDLSILDKYSQREDVGVMEDSLAVRRETLEHLEKGNVPPLLAPTSAATTPPLPVVTTVEVPVPDVETEKTLEDTQRDLDGVRDRCHETLKENIRLREEATRLNGELSAKRIEVEELQRDMEDLRLMGGVGMLADPQASKKLEDAEKELHDCQLEIEKMQKERKEMHRDLKKVLRKEAKLQAQVKAGDAVTRKFLLNIAEQNKIIRAVVPAATTEASNRMDVAIAELSPISDELKSREKAVKTWEKQFKKTHAKDPVKSDRDAEGLEMYELLSLANQKAGEKQATVNALKLLAIGTVPEMSEVKGQEGKEVSTQDDAMTDKLDEKISDLEVENNSLKDDKDRLNQKIKDLEDKLVAVETEGSISGRGVVTAVDTGLHEEIALLKNKVASLEADLTQEVAAHEHTREELETIERQLSSVTADVETQKLELEAKIENGVKASSEIVKSKEVLLTSKDERIEELEKQQLANVPLDTAAEIKLLRAQKNTLEKEKSSSSTKLISLTSQLTELQTKLDSSSRSLDTQRQSLAQSELKVKGLQTEKAQIIKEWSGKAEKKESELNKEKQTVVNLEKRLKKLEEVAITGSKGGDKALKEQLLATRRENNELNERLRRTDVELKGDAAAERMQTKRHEKILREMEKKLEAEKRKCEKQEENLKLQEDELKNLRKDHGSTGKELAALHQEMATLTLAATEGIEAAAKVKQLESDVKRLNNDNKVLTENCNSERVLRKKYYNMVEDMKGKIRVYCRSRPISNTEAARGNYSVVKSPDEYTLVIESSRGTKEFQFDSIFMEDSSQERIFDDTNNLIQSAVDGYNVCIFAYGQTGSGKTFTMIGDRGGNFPGIAPRAFHRIFEVIKENQNKFKFEVTTYMLELYNEQLIDLYSSSGHLDHEKLEIRKDKKGMVFVQGAHIKPASNNKELFALFEEGSKNRHTASTQMNAESSRSHLVIAVVIESTNLSTGQVIRGKLSLVDLAGSERASKTGASAEQLKEAMSINKSLSALGDVISALSSEQSFIPYRNNKLTMLMQDSLGGNAKTLMFVNISPADYNVDESVVSLTYASRVKLITNDASKNSDNKEIARLKGIVARLKRGEQVNIEEEDVGVGEGEDEG